MKPAMNSLVFIFSVAALAIATQGILAVDYTVTNSAPNTPGGAQFDRDIGEPYALQIMNDTTYFVWNTFFKKTAPIDRKQTKAVGLFIDAMVREDWVAYTSNDQIHYSARYITGNSDDLKRGFIGVLYHEMTHVWQWTGNGQAPGGLIEGIADFVRLKAGYGPSHWVSPGQGDRWDQGYDVTARFLEYCESRLHCFVAKLNKKLRYGYNSSCFEELLGSSVDQLWMDYKAKYGTA